MTYYQPITVSTEAITDFQENKQNKNQKKNLGSDIVSLGSDIHICKNKPLD